LYDNEYQWGSRFEALVARITADFIDNYDPHKERCWIAERDDGSFMGCVMLVKDPDSQDAAKLRLLLVEPEARGMGVGSKLIQQCVSFAQQVGYKRVVLWTQSTLTPARRLYSAAGFKLIHQEEHATFGVKLTAEVWELHLPKN
jgi:GNAT superfamily N-acetyltransferase